MACINPDKNSNYLVFNIDSHRDWKEIYSELVIENHRYFGESEFEMIPYYFNSKWGLGSINSVVLEKKYNDKDYRDSYYNFFSKKFTAYPKNCMRLHFFSEKFKSYLDIWRLEDIEKEKREKTNGNKGIYLGNIICRPLSHGCIGRTTISASRIDMPSFFACQAEYEVNILGSRLLVEGFPFTSQDTDVSQCALAALWMILRYYSQRYPNYREIYPHEISQLPQDFSRGRILPAHRGLTIQNLTEALTHYGFSPVLYLKQSYQYNPSLFYRTLYYYVESGIPLIIGLPGHAVALFGHYGGIGFTPCAPFLNCCQDNGRFINSCCFNQGYIINDDNYLPYQILQKRDGLMRGADNRFAAGYVVNDIQSFVVPLYEKIYLPAEKVDELAKTIINNRNIGIDSFSKMKLTPNQNLVIRIFLTSSRSYKYFRKNNIIPGHVDRYYIYNQMPKFIWVAEISTLDLYKNEKIIGEIILDATANQNDRNAFMFIHYPGILIINDRNSIGDNPNRYQVLDLGIDKNFEYELYRNNLKRGGSL